MPPKAAGGWDDDDDDNVPLAAIIKPKAAPAKATVADQTSPSRTLKKEDKKDKEVRQRKAQPKVDLEDVLKPVRSAPAKGKQTLPEYVKSNLGAIVAGTVVLVLIYGAIVSDGTNFDDSAERVDPYQALGLPKSASDKEIKAAYRKLSLELHPDKNPDQSEDDAERFKAVTQGYKILSDPEKKKKWLNHESVDEKGIPSDTETLNDASAYKIKKGAWLLLAYADWSSECWELAETWEKVGKDLGRYVNVARFNYEKSPGLAKKLSTFSVPMIYSYVDGVRTPFLGEPSLENITLFMTKSLTDSVEVIQDKTGAMFLENHDVRVKALLFAQQGMVKLRLAVRSLARQHVESMDVAEVTYKSADHLRHLFNITHEPAIVFVKERGSRPLIYTGKMTQVKLTSLFEQHQHHWVPRLGEHNVKSLCGAGTRGTQPCVVYLSDGAPPSSVMEVLRNSSTLELDALASAPVDYMPTAFTWADLSVHSSLRKAFGGSKASVVAVDAKTKTFAPYDGQMTPTELKDWAETFRGRLESDMDPLAGPMAFKREWRARWSWRQLLRNMTPHLMTFIALVAAWLLWYAMQNLWSDWRSSTKSKKTREAIFKGRAKLLEGETRKLSKWEQLEKQNAEARERKRQAEEEKEAKRQALEQASAAAREADAAKARAAEEARRVAAAAAAKQQQQEQPKGPAKAVNDDELKRAIHAIVAAADLSTTTKSSIREALQAKYPKVDLLARKELIQSEITAAVAARAQ